MTTEAVMDKPLFLPSKSSKHITNQGKQFIVQYDEVYSNFIAPIIAESKTKQYQITCMTRSHDTYTSICVIWRAVSIARPAETYVDSAPRGTWKGDRVLRSHFEKSHFKDFHFEV